MAKLIIKPVSISQDHVWARCINPQHEDKHPSLEITLTGEYEGRCWCHGCRKMWQLNKEDVEKLKTMATDTGPVIRDFAEEYYQTRHEAFHNPQKSQPYNQKLADEWHVHPLILDELGLFWWDNCYLIPMFDSSKKLCGVQRRYLDGFKNNLHGSKLGVFLGSIPWKPDKPIFLTEGCSDLACLLDLGFQGLGRPNCDGGIGIVIEYLENHAKASNKLIVMADNDEAGQWGATKLCEAWNEFYAPTWKMSIWTPDEKDLRDEVNVKGSDEVRILLGSIT